jgi:hypothetical protein
MTSFLEIYSIACHPHAAAMNGISITSLISKFMGYVYHRGCRSTQPGLNWSKAVDQDDQQVCCDKIELSDCIHIFINYT